jgi:GntR family transcriptional regulator
VPDWTKGQPAYKQVAEALRAAIRAGDIKEGDPLPSYAEIQNQHGVSITVAREAIRQLRMEGLVASHQGKGVFVLPGARQAQLPPGDELAALRRDLEALTARVARLEKSDPSARQPK